MTDLFAGFATLFADPIALGFVFFGTIVGVLIGATPGLTTAAAVAMLVPATFYMSPLHALVFMYVIGKAGRFGGSIAAILFNTPGTAAAAATQIDGYPMAKRGEADRALKTAAVSSVTGDFLGDCLLIFGAVWISQYTVRLGPPEYFAIYVMAFVVIGSVISDSVLKGLASALLGVLISFVGFSEITGETRYDFGSIDLMSGFTLPPLLIGLLVVSEVLLQSARRSPDGVADSRGDRQRARYSFADFKTCLPVSLRSSAIGALIGALPGLGSSVAAFVAYGEEKRRAGPDAKWGTGVIQGVAAPESANNAVNGPSMIPVLTLGIPGTTVAAVLIGVFVIHGVQVGPSIFQTSRDLVYGLFAAGLIAIVTYGLIGYFGGGLIGRIIAVVPVRVIYPTVFLLSIVAAYSLRNSLFDVLVVLVAGVAGFFMRKRGYSPAALIIAFILAGGAEDTLTQSMMMSSNGMLIFLERPAALVFFAIGLAAFAWRLRVSLRAESRPISSPSHSTGSVR